MTNRTNEALLARRALAEKATDGPWEQIKEDYVFGPDDWGYIMAKREDDHSIHCYEIAKVNAYGRRDDAAFIAANSPDVVKEDIDEILRLRAENKWLEQEAEWLAARCREFCISHNLCAECPMLRGPFTRTNCESECGAYIELRFEKNIVQDWREAARKAMEENR